MTGRFVCCLCRTICLLLVTRRFACDRVISLLSLQPEANTVRGQAGTYIKEFVHSDEDRTVPNLGSLLGCQEPAHILELDVLEIHMPFLT